VRQRLEEILHPEGIHIGQFNLLGKVQGEKIYKKTLKKEIDLAGGSPVVVPVPTLRHSSYLQKQTNQKRQNKEEDNRSNQRQQSGQRNTQGTVRDDLQQISPHPINFEQLSDKSKFVAKQIAFIKQRVGGIQKQIQMIKKTPLPQANHMLNRTQQVRPTVNN